MKQRQQSAGDSPPTARTAHITTTRKLCFEHPLWRELHPNAPSQTKVQISPRKWTITPECWEGETPLPALLGPRFSERKPKSDESLAALPALRLVLTVFYSFADVAAFLGPRLARVIADQLRKGKSLRISKYGWVKLPYVIREAKTKGDEVIERQLMVSIRDLFGLDYESLQNTAAAYNVPMPAKGLMADYKLCMDRAYLERKGEMIEYALGDLVLAELWNAYERNYEQLCDLFEVTPKFPPPATKGSFVASLFAEVLNERLGLPEDFCSIFDVGPVQKGWRDRAPPIVTSLLRLYGCKSLAQSDSELTRRFLALVHGGRVKNENPLKIRHEGLVMSMDLVSCYGKALQYLSLPIGHPSMFYYPHHRPAEWPRLGEFLKQYRREMVEGAWYLVIETNSRLSFPQNLLYSKLFPSDNPELVKDAKDNDESREDLAHIKGDFILLENEVRNGILTHYSLSLIEHCASDQELGELMTKLSVKSGMLYTRSYKTAYEGPESVTEWLEKSRMMFGKLTTDCGPKKHSTEDARVGP